MVPSKEGPWSSATSKTHSPLTTKPGASSLWSALGAGVSQDLKVSVLIAQGDEQFKYLMDIDREKTPGFRENTAL